MLYYYHICYRFYFKCIKFSRTFVFLFITNTNSNKSWESKIRHKTVLIQMHTKILESTQNKTAVWKKSLMLLCSALKTCLSTIWLKKIRHTSNPKALMSFCLFVYYLDKEIKKEIMASILWKYKIPSNHL